MHQIRFRLCLRPPEELRALDHSELFLRDLLLRGGKRRGKGKGKGEKCEREGNGK